MPGFAYFSSSADTLVAQTLARAHTNEWTPLGETPGILLRPVVVPHNFSKNLSLTLLRSAVPQIAVVVVFVLDDVVQSLSPAADIVRFRELLCVTF